MRISSANVNTATPTATPIPNSETRKNSPPSPTAPAALSSPVSPTSESSSFPAKAVVAGFFPGMIAGALLLFLIMFLLKWRRERDDRHSGSFGHISATVSDPIYVKPQDTYRTDFLRRSSSTNSKPAMTNNVNGLSGFGAEINAYLSAAERNPDKNSPPRRTQDALGRSHPDPPAIRTTPSSPRASTVSIDVFADPTPNSLYPTGLRPPPADTRGSYMTTTTTFGDIMAGAAGSIYGGNKPSTRNNSNTNNNARRSFGDGTDNGGDPFVASPFRDPQSRSSGNTCIPPLQYNLRLPPRSAKFPTGLRN
ncbi:MAG: hypothetical protein M1840_005614 [Geoglossum simile]|nr:MAG: hypothetical protein M1840_005614 [Geoglossum simile]